MDDNFELKDIYSKSEDIFNIDFDKIKDLDENKFIEFKTSSLWGQNLSTEELDELIRKKKSYELKVFKQMLLKL